MYGRSGWGKSQDMKKVIVFLLLSTLVIAADKVLRFTQHPFHLNTRVFLIAGSQDSANFAQEVINQKKIWMNRGIRPEEISCYYALPVQQSLEADLQQFQSLTEPLAECHPANPYYIRSHLRAVSTQNPKQIFMYFSSHGNILNEVALAKITDEPSRRKGLDAIKSVPALADFHFLFDSSPTGSIAYETDKIAAAKKGRMADYFMTPKLFADMMQLLPPLTEKTIVLQACHSGGFITNQVSKVANLTLMTSARADRQSYGCDHGSIETAFGELFNHELGKLSGSGIPGRWESFYQAVRDGVASKEKTMKITLPSEPQWLSTHKIKMLAE